MEERAQELQARLGREFEGEVRRRVEEAAGKREKEAMVRYRTQYERERKEMEARLKNEFETRLKEARAEVEKDRVEAARLKSVE